MRYTINASNASAGAFLRRSLGIGRLSTWKLRKLLLDLSPGLAFDRHPLAFLSARIKVDGGGGAVDFVFLLDVGAAVLLHRRGDNLPRK
jgi:hypothetical protein